MSIIVSTIGIVFLVLCLILFCNAMMFIQKSSKNDQVPVKYGRYQRNVTTFKQSMVFGASKYLWLLAYVIVMNNEGLIEPHILRQVILWCNLIVFDISYGVLWPCFILITLKERIPDFFKFRHANKVDFIDLENIPTEIVILPRGPHKTF